MLMKSQQDYRRPILTDWTERAVDWSVLSYLTVSKHKT